MDIAQVRGLWREQRKQEPPSAFSKDLLARALAYWLQEERLGGLPPDLRRLLASVGRTGSARCRRLKVGSVIVREHRGQVHEVLVVANGFCWRGEVYSSLSVIAKKITGTTWNGPRFFGLRPEEQPRPTADSEKGASAPRRKAAAGASQRVRPATTRREAET